MALAQERLARLSLAPSADTYLYLGGGNGWGNGWPRWMNNVRVYDSPINAAQAETLYYENLITQALGSEESRP